MAILTTKKLLLEVCLLFPCITSLSSTEDSLSPTAVRLRLTSLSSAERSCLTAVTSDFSDSKRDSMNSRVRGAAVRASSPYAWAPPGDGLPLPAGPCLRVSISFTLWSFLLLLEAIFRWVGN